MLVLSRYRDESIYIGDDVRVTVVDIRGDRVRIGIQAPPNVTVHRQEVYEAIINSQTKVAKHTRESRISNNTQGNGDIPQKFSSPLRSAVDARKTKTAVSLDTDFEPITCGTGIEVVR